MWAEFLGSRGEQLSNLWLKKEMVQCLPHNLVVYQENLPQSRYANSSHVWDYILYITVTSARTSCKPAEAYSFLYEQLLTIITGCTGWIFGTINNRKLCKTGKVVKGYIIFLTYLSKLGFYHRIRT